MALQSKPKQYTEMYTKYFDESVGKFSIQLTPSDYSVTSSVEMKPVYMNNDF